MKRSFQLRLKEVILNYLICYNNLGYRKRAIPDEFQVVVYLYYISGEGRYCKTANAFGVSLASISSIIRRVLLVVATFLGHQLIKLQKSEVEVNELRYKFLETHGFSQCI